jgi:hypothetical protein
MMRTVIVWWELSGSAQTIESLRTYLLDESVTAFAEVPGLRAAVQDIDRRPADEPVGRGHAV